jgi:DNA-binding MarR family transcriptional regulator
VSTTAPAAVSTDTRALLLAYLDAMALAEPLQARLWERAELTLTQLSALRELRDGPQTASRLGAAVGLSPASVTRLVDRLERRGLVSRRREIDDRRYVEIRLEPAAERLLGQLKVVKGTALHSAVEAMDPDERRRLTAGLCRLIELARAAEEQRGDDGRGRA